MALVHATWIISKDVYVTFIFSVFTLSPLVQTLYAAHLLPIHRLTYVTASSSRLQHPSKWSFKKQSLTWKYPGVTFDILGLTANSFSLEFLHWDWWSLPKNAGKQGQWESLLHAGFVMRLVCVCQVFPKNSESCSNGLQTDRNVTRSLYELVVILEISHHWNQTNVDFWVN